MESLQPSTLPSEDAALNEQVRLAIEERVRVLQENLALIPVRPLPQVPQTEVRYTPEGERLAAVVNRLALQRGATEEEMSAIAEEVARNYRSAPKLAPPQAPLERAQEMMCEAQLSNGRKRIKLARRALQISPDCADAYILLANEDAADNEEAKPLLEEAVAAAERAVRSTLGDEIWNGKHEFWHVLRARPYLRAQAALAYCLWEGGEHEAAIAIFQHMLQLDPQDHQNLRYPLAVCLLDTGRDEELTTLLKQYDDDDSSAHWLYTRALLAFKHTGSNAHSLDALDAAFDCNRAIPLCIVGLAQPPQSIMQDFSPGGEHESREYLMGNLRFWVSTPGAMLWMAERLTRQLRQMEAKLGE